jgi:hypothetical protein
MEVCWLSERVNSSVRLAALLPATPWAVTRCRQVIGPHFLVDDQLRSVARGGVRQTWSRIAARGRTPIFRRVRDPPDISVGVQRDPNQEEFSIIAERETVCHSCRDAPATGKPVEHDRSFKMQGLRTAKSATLRAHNQDCALLGKWPHPIEAGHADGNLHPNSAAAANRFGRLNIHGQARDPSWGRPSLFSLCQIGLRWDGDKSNSLS